MNIPKVGIVPHYIFNNTSLEWFEFQDAVQEALKTSLHCLPHKEELEILQEAKEHNKYPGVYFEIWGKINSEWHIDIAIINASKPEETQE